MQRPFPAYAGDEPYIFVSYAHADDRQVYPELRVLRDAGLNIWYDEGISPGANWKDELAQKIGGARFVLFYVSPNSASSAHCRNEIDFALELDRRILQVYLKPTELPPGLRFALTGQQAIIKQEVSEADYRKKLSKALQDYLSADDVATRVQLKAPDRRGLLAGLFACLCLVVIVSGYLLSREGAERTGVVQGSVAARSEPLPLLIADFDNKTGQVVFDEVLEEGLSVGMEGAPFITSYPRSDARKALKDLIGEASLTAKAARLFAARVGLELVLVGTIERDGGGYELSVEGVNPLSEEILVQASETAESPLDALTAIARLAESLRRGLGDVEVETTHLSEIFTAANIDAVVAFARAQSLAAEWRHAEAVVHYELAAQLDPEFGRAYGGWAYSSGRIGQLERSKQLWETSLTLLNTMTERERLRTLGVYYMTSSGNMDKGIETIEELVAKYPVDAAGLNNLAVAYFDSGQFVKARGSGAALVEIYPKSVLYRGNLALYDMYAGDLQQATENATETLGNDPSYYLAYLPLAIAALAEPDYAAAEAHYAAMTAINPQSASLANLGLSDLALARGDLPLAIDLLAAGSQADDENGNPSAATIKRLWLARALLDSSEQEQALDIADSIDTAALSARQELELAELNVDLGRSTLALSAAERLEASLPEKSRALGALIRGLVALEDENPQSAIEHLRTSLALRDTWQAHLLMGRAYLLAGYAVEAMDEFDECWERRAESFAMFLDDRPSYQRFAELPYWRGKAQQSVGMIDDALSSYRDFLGRRDRGDDATLADAKAQLAALTAP